MRFVLSIVTAVCLAVGAGAQPAPRAIDVILHTPRGDFHAVDWGGAGETVVLLAGLGNTAHVFDDFAPLLTDSFHVVALTRRGFGASVKGGRLDADTLADDITAALDTLGVERAHLVGHSYAGDEITRFAALHPQRLVRAVYLDAAYDRAAIRRHLFASLFAQPKPPTPPKARKKDKASMAAYQTYLERVYGVRWPEAEARAAIDHAGDAAPLKLMLSAKAPDYRGVLVPALAIYARQDSVAQAYPWLRGGWGGKDTLFAALALSGTVRVSPPNLNAWNWLHGRWLPFVESQREKFAREAGDGRVVEVHGPHYLFLSQPHEIARLVREFLAG